MSRRKDQRIKVTAKDIQKLEGVCKGHASRRMTQAKKEVGKDAADILTVWDYAKFLKISPSDLIEIMNTDENK